MKILYITFIDFSKDSSGSTVRPHMMYQAFLDLGLEVKLLEGQQNKRQERKQKVKEILQWLKTNRPDICYVETPSGPFFNSIDLKLLKTVKKMKVPIGLFYRDAYWKFRDLFPMPLWKSVALYFMHKRDLKLFSKVCDYLYFPSSSFAKLFDNYKFKNVKNLYPGGVDKIFAQNNFNKKCFFYVGGTSKRYGGLKLIKVFEKINENEIVANLIFISQETADFSRYNYNYPWLEIIHTFDRQLIEEKYCKATYAMIPFEIDEYSNLTMPLKLFEYLGYGVPVLSTNCQEISKFVNENECGLICDDSVDALIDIINNGMDSEEKYLEYKKNAINVGNINRWIDRAETVVKDLQGANFENITWYD